MTNAAKRVVFVTGTSAIWGAELSMLSIARHTPTIIRPILICSSGELASQWTESVGPNVNKVRARRGRLSRNLGFFFNLPRLVRKHDVLVVFDFYLMPAMVALLPYLRIRRVRLVVDVHDGVQDHPRRRLFFWLMRFTDCCIAISEYIAAQVQHRTVPVVYRGVDDVARAHRTSRPLHDPPVVGIVGQIQPAKRTEFALRAIAASEVNARIRIRGEASSEFRAYEGAVRSYAERVFGERALFDGSVPRAEVMQGLDVLFFANSNEPFGRVMVEAQLAGTVAVAPASGGALEVFDHGASGFLYAPGDLDDAARALREAIDEAGTGSFAARARLLALERFHPARQARRYFDTLQSIDVQASQRSLAGSRNALRRRRTGR